MPGASTKAGQGLFYPKELTGTSRQLHLIEEAELETDDYDPIPAPTQA